MSKNEKKSSTVDNETKFPKWLTAIIVILCVLAIGPRIKAALTTDDTSQPRVETIDTGEVNWAPGGTKRFTRMSSGNSGGRKPSLCNNTDALRVLFRDATPYAASHRASTGGVTSESFVAEMRGESMFFRAMNPHEILQRGNTAWRICEADLNLMANIPNMARPFFLDSYRVRYMIQYQNNVKTNVVAILYLVHTGS